MAELMESNAKTGFEIAVIGMTGRFPGARNTREFWENLKNGVEFITFLSDAELLAAGVTPDLIESPDYAKIKGGVLEDVEYFDASFFGYIPAEAEIMDPQTRLFHECAWEALEDAGYDPDSYKGMIGVYAGSSANIKWQSLVLSSEKIEQVGEFETGSLMERDYLCTRVSYKLHLNGPGVVIHTACSTSLVAIHTACRALLNGECHMALAGGVSIPTHYVNGYLYHEGMVYAPDGHCRAFDGAAKGIVGGSGVGIVVLKSLEDAIADRDHIYAVVKGTAINNDGVRKIGYTAPSIEGQAEVIRAAQHMAEVDPESITYIEAHGTGTILGDPIEIEALTQAFNTDKKGFCSIGSVKTNIGHLDSAAGAAGFIKTVLALKHRLIPPSLHFETPNPKIDFDNSPFYVNTTLREWKNADGPLRAGVSSFGIGGTNAHVVLEAWSMEHGAWGEDAKSREYQLILLSARTPSALDKMTENLGNYFQENLPHPGNLLNPGLTLADAAYTLQVGRQTFPHRRMLVCSTGGDAAAALSSNDPAKVQTFYSKAEERNVVFMFSGQGSQYVDMGLELYRTEPVFREEMDRCFALLEPLMGCDIKTILYPGEAAEGDREKAGKEAEEKINHVIYSGPVKFIFEYCLAKLIMKWGIQPRGMIGHSFGEYAAACLAGVFSLEDALNLVVLRGKVMEKTPPGAMMSVPLPEEELKSLLNSNNSISLAAVNTASLCIVSGPVGAVDAFEKELNRQDIEGLRLNFPRASHSAQMEPVLKEFENSAARVTFNKPRLPYIAGLTGKWITDGDIPDQRYWARHLRETVRFKEGIDHLVKELNPVFVQVGSDRGLPLFVGQHSGTTGENLTVNLVRHPKEKESDVRYLLDKMGQLWLWGVKIDWSAFYASEERYRVPLPTYPFERQRFWLEGGPSRIGVEICGRSSAASKKRNPADWLYIPSWKRTKLPRYHIADIGDRCCWLFFLDDFGLGVQLMERLDEHIICVKTGLTFNKSSDLEYTVNPRNPGDYIRLLGECRKSHNIPSRILHLWSVSGDNGGNLEMTQVESDLDSGYYSLLYLAQAIGSHSIADEIRLDVVTNNMQAVSDEALLCPAKAAVLGPVKVIPQEYPNIRCRSIDIDIENFKPGKRKRERLVNQLIVEFERGSSDTVIAYRGLSRWIRIFEPARLEEAVDAKSRIIEKGVYLITGGLGGVGLWLAGYLAAQYQARLILTGRSPFPPPETWDHWLNTHPTDDPVSCKISKIREMESLGTKVMIAAADVSDCDRMRETIIEAEKRFGRINGVIHAAGVPDGVIIHRRTGEDSEAVFASKIRGTLVLNHILKETGIDFMVLCSSLSSILALYGDVGYCAANAFLDAFAYYNTYKTNETPGTSNDGIFTVSIGWNAWKDVGLVREAAMRLSEMTGIAYTGSVLDDWILPEEGIELFSRIMKDTLPWVAVSTEMVTDSIEWQNRTSHGGDGVSGVLDVVEKITTARKRYPRPELSTPYAAPRSALEQTLVGIWERFFGFEKIGIHDDFFQLGGDSLKAMTAAANIHKELNVKIPIAEFFKRPTVSGIAEYLKKAVQTIHSAIEPVEEKEYYPLSSAQKRLYTLREMEEDSCAYNVLIPLFIEKDLDKEKLREIFGTLINRHESLRTSFVKIEGNPVQKIQKDVDFKIEYYSTEGKSTLPASIRENFVRPFDLSLAPLLRIGLVKTGEKENVLLVDMHHIITDGTSINILIWEFLSLYAGDELEPLRLQYKDFSTWQNDLIESGKIKSQVDYWLNLYAGEIPILNLPTDYKRPDVFTFEGAVYCFELEPDTSKQFKELCKRTNATLFINMFAAFNVLLHKYTGQDDFIVGTGIAGRPHADLQDTNGMFVNMLAVRNYPGGGETYETFLEEVKEKSLQAFENQDVQFEYLIDRLNIQRDPSRNPLFDVVMAVQNFRQVSEGFSTGKNSGLVEQILSTGENLSAEWYKTITSKFDMTFFVHEEGDEIQIYLEYYTRIFEEATVKRMVSHFKNIVKIVAVEPSIKLKDMDIASHGEKRQVLYEFNDTRREYPRDKTIPQLFAGEVARAPDRIALIGSLSAVTYRKLDERSNRLACYLQHRWRIGVDELVGLLLDRSIDMIVAILGILKAGGAYLPLAPSFPRESIGNMLRDSNTAVVISEKRYINILNRLQWECPSFRCFLCFDSDDIHAEEEREKSELMERKLWHYVAETANDDITGGGWLSSYTGEPIPREEMDEYGDNILKKLTPLLHPGMKVLEVGCASGITMKRIAPRVGFYHGSDLSEPILEKNKQWIKEKKLTNIRQTCLPAHEIDKIEKSDFDLVIINSVIQCFHGHNYLRRVIRKAVDKIGEKGYLFIGDIMDKDLKEDLVKDLRAFKQAHKDKGYKTKTDWSAELFITRDFLKDLTHEIPGIKEIEFSDKIYTIENELTRYRYDALLSIDKSPGVPKGVGMKHKYQEDARALERYGWEPVLSDAAAHNLAYIIYTSGTTGRPKGVMVRNEGFINLVYYYQELFAPDVGSRISQVANPSFDAMGFEVWPCLLSGAALYIADNDVRMDPGKMKEWLIEKGINISFQPTVTAELLLKEEWPETGVALRILQTAGDRLTTYPRRSYPFRIYNLYGPTEDTVWTTWAEVNVKRKEDPLYPSIGKPVANHRVYILDPNGNCNLQPVGVAGELCIIGAGVAVGYLNKPELTAEKFNRSYNSYRTYIFYKTGDLARWLPDPAARGAYIIEFLGRIDLQVKIRGYRVELGEIESHLLQHDNVKEAVVITREQSGEKYLCAYIVSPEGEQKTLDISALREYLSQTLPHYMIPSHFVSIDKIPLTTNGKVDRKALPAPKAPASRDYAAPANEIEEKLIKIWSEILNIDHQSIGINDNFFELGGHSLKATVMISKIHKELEVKLPLTEVFRTPNVRGLSAYMRKAVKDKYFAIEPTEKKEYYPLSSAQKRLFTLHHMETDSTYYHNSMAVLLEGKLERARMEKVLRKLVERHEVFRTSFEMIGNVPFQKIYRDVDFKVAYYDNVGEADEEKIIRSFVKPFDITRPPLLRIGLLKKNHDKHVFMIEMHHIITDGTSLVIFGREFQALYAGEGLPPLKLQYKDYSGRHNKLMASKKMKKQENYWLKQLEGEIPLLNLPTDFPTPSVQNLDGDMIPFEIDGDLYEKIKRLAAKTGSTVYIVLLSVYTLLLSKLSEQEDIVVGTPIAGRTHSDLQNIVGFFINMLVMRNQPKANKTYNEFLMEVKENALKAYENQDYPFEVLVEKLHFKRESGRHALIDAVILLHNQNEPLSEFGIYTEDRNGTEESKLEIREYEMNLKKSPFHFMY